MSDTGNWLKVDLRQSGTNTRAVGAWVEVEAGGAVQAREITVGGGHAGGQSGPASLRIGRCRDGAGPGDLAGRLGQQMARRTGERGDRDRPDRLGHPLASAPGSALGCAFVHRRPNARRADRLARFGVCRDAPEARQGPKACHRKAKKRGDVVRHGARAGPR